MDREGLIDYGCGCDVFQRLIDTMYSRHSLVMLLVFWLVKRRAQKMHKGTQGYVMIFGNGLFFEQSKAKHPQQTDGVLVGSSSFFLFGVLALWQWGMWSSDDNRPHKSSLSLFGNIFLFY